VNLFWFWGIHLKVCQVRKGQVEEEGDGEEEDAEAAADGVDEAEVPSQVLQAQVASAFYKLKVVSLHVASLQVANYKWKFTSVKLQVASLHVANHKSRVTSHKSQVTSHKFQITSVLRLSSKNKEEGPTHFVLVIVFVINRISQ
jgi:hypothetical protein